MLGGLILNRLTSTDIWLVNIESIETVSNLVPIVRQDPSLTVGLPICGLHAACKEWLLKLLSVVHIAHEVATPFRVGSLSFSRLSLVGKAVLKVIGIGVHVVDDLLLHSG